MIVEDPERYLMTNDVLKIVQLYYTHHPVSERLRIALMSYQGFYGTVRWLVYPQY